MSLCRPGKLFLFPGADSELMDPSVSQNLPAAPDDAGVGKFHTQIVLSQIRVGIQMDDMKIRVLPCHGPDASKGHKMLSSDQKRKFSVL